MLHRRKQLTIQRTDATLLRYYLYVKTQRIVVSDTLSVYGGRLTGYIIEIFLNMLILKLL
jgi:hypothetical protein